MKTNKQSIGVVLGLIALVVSGVGITKLVGAYSGGSPKVVIESVQNYNESSDAQVMGSASLVRQADEASNVMESGRIDPTLSKVLVDGYLYSPMPAKGAVTTTAYLINNTGSDIYINNYASFVKFTGTVSSTVSIGCGLSTSGTGLAAYTTTPPVDIIAATNEVTSTAGTAAASLVQPANTIVGLTFIPNGSTVLCGWKQPYDNGCTGAKCEAVTSTNRGYDATINFPYYRVNSY